jgi:hypothetical protein
MRLRLFHRNRQHSRRSSEADQARACSGVIIIADYFHGNRDGALAHAQQLNAAGTRLFIFHQHHLRSADNEVLRSLAETTGGAYVPYNPAVERIAERLPRLFEAVGHFAIGGIDALEALAESTDAPERGGLLRSNDEAG